MILHFYLLSKFRMLVGLLLTFLPKHSQTMNLFYGAGTCFLPNDALADWSSQC